MAPRSGHGGSKNLQSFPADVITGWTEYVEGGNVTLEATQATSFAHFSVGFSAEQGCRLVEPRHFCIIFPVKEQGRTKHHSALLTLRIVREGEIPRDPNVPGPVANHLRFKSADERKAISGADEYLEFELLSRPDQAPSTQPLRITTGPVQVNKETGLKEYLCIEFSQCIQSIATDLYQNPRSGERLVQNRWWICIETLRLLCTVKDINCGALDAPGTPHVEWAIRLVDNRVPVNKREVPEEPQEKDIEELMEFIDGAAGGANSGLRADGRRSEGVDAPSRLNRSKKKKKAGKDKDTQEASPFPESCANGTGDTYASGNSAGSANAPSNNALGGSTEAIISPSAQSGEDEGRDDLMSELLNKYRELQELSQHLELDTRIATVRGLLQVLDELEVASDATSEEDSLASRALVTVASTFEAKLRSLGMERMVTLGRPFDPELHRMVRIGSLVEEAHAGPWAEASLPASPKASRPDQVVIEELESGWVCGTTVVRPAVVEVGP